jgi:L-asparaginase
MIIRLLLTGGTFDKEYDELTGQMKFDRPHVEDMLTVSRTTCDLRIDQPLFKDSLDMTQADRDLITNACQNATENNIIITHGTDTMVETALTILQARLTDKVIVLTGAMVPYSFGIRSDAMFNLGNALAFVQVLKPGVYIAMNGHYFPADNVQKDKVAGRFIEK